MLLHPLAWSTSPLSFSSYIFFYIYTLQSYTQWSENKLHFSRHFWASQLFHQHSCICLQSIVRKNIYAEHLPLMLILEEDLNCWEPWTLRMQAIGQFKSGLHQWKLSYIVFYISISSLVSSTRILSLPKLPIHTATLINKQFWSLRTLPV